MDIQDESFKFVDIKVSGGQEVKENSTVLLFYRMALSKDDLINGKCIESTYSPDIPIAVNVNRETLLEGFYRSLLGMHGGGSIRQMVIPPSMGYGERGYGTIPSRATLFVEVSVVTVDNDMSLERR